MAICFRVFANGDGTWRQVGVWRTENEAVGQAAELRGEGGHVMWVCCRFDFNPVTDQGTHPGIDEVRTAVYG